MKVHLKKSPQAGLNTLVVYAVKDRKTGKPSAPKLSADLQRVFEFAQLDFHFSGDKKESAFFRRCDVDGYVNVLFIGIGEMGAITLEDARIAGAVTLAALENHKVTSAGAWGESLMKPFKDGAAAFGAWVEGVELADYDYDELKSKPKPKKGEPEKPKLESVTFLTSTAPTAVLQKALARAEVLVECQNFTRWLGDTPGNLMTPTRLADETAKAAKGTGLKVTIWDRARIVKEKFGGLLSVSLGSAQEPRFIIMEYNGASKGTKPVCFVGKGLTFDSGGISIKPSPSMEEMKYDMCGGAAVIGTMLALAKLKAKVNAIGFVPSTENMPGPDALKPGDVYIARNGKSVEVHNTDAEGRLILGDALAYASEQKPAVILDAATLTGAIMIALGNTHTGVFTRDRKLMKQVQESADRSGELVWPMPLTAWHTEDIKGTHADINNAPGGRLAGSSTAAAFLEHFVDKEIPWAHFDIAGTANNVSSRFPYCPKKGASGIMVRTFVDFAESF